MENVRRRPPWKTFGAGPRGKHPGWDRAVLPPGFGSTPETASPRPDLGRQRAGIHDAFLRRRGSPKPSRSGRRFHRYAPAHRPTGRPETCALATPPNATRSRSHAIESKAKFQESLEDSVSPMKRPPGIGISETDTADEPGERTGPKGVRHASHDVFDTAPEGARERDRETKQSMTCEEPGLSSRHASTTQRPRAPARQISRMSFSFAFRTSSTMATCLSVSFWISSSARFSSSCETWPSFSSFLISSLASRRI
jgi:hypothetical protein